MKVRFVNFTMSLAAAAAAMTLSTAPALAQAPNSEAAKVTPAWTPAHLPDGQPDVRGYWVAKVYGMGCLTNPRSGPGCVDEFETRGSRPKPPKAASRIIDTPDGEIPYQPWARQKQQYFLKNYFEPTRQEFLDPQQLCLPLGAVRQVTWHDIHLLQYDGYVVFEHEGGHAYQIIPLDGRPHIGPSLKLWMGDSRGHWEGNTLVVDVTNSNAKGRLSRSADFSSDKVHNVVRITFLDANNARYEATFDDPSVYTRPWTFGLDLKRGIFGAGGADEKTYEQWEEACYEGMRPIDRSLRPGNPVSATLEEKK
jgi:hypothetical protein